MNFSFSSRQETTKDHKLINFSQHRKQQVGNDDGVSLITVPTKLLRTPPSFCVLPYGATCLRVDSCIHYKNF
jgi:hypothetical protein